MFTAPLPSSIRPTVARARVLRECVYDPLPSNGYTRHITPSLRLFVPKSLQAYRHFFFSEGCAFSFYDRSHLPSDGSAFRWKLVGGSGSLQSLHSNARIILQIKPRISSSTFFTIHYHHHPIKDSLQPELLTMPLNKPQNKALLLLLLLWIRHFVLKRPHSERQNFSHTKQEKIT
jgi:hypothetical protein